MSGCCAPGSPTPSSSGTQDRKRRWRAGSTRLKERVFHAKLGTVYRQGRADGSSRPDARAIGAGCRSRSGTASGGFGEGRSVERLVGEFPELQGIMGRYLALNDGENPETADAIARHYAPMGASDPTPTAPVDIVVSLADKIDTLVGFFFIEEALPAQRTLTRCAVRHLVSFEYVLENRLRVDS